MNNPRCSMSFHYPLMEVSKSYDVISESDLRVSGIDSSESDDDLPKLRTTTKWRDFFRRKKLSDEIATTPNGYWDISSEQFACALNLKPQFRFSTSSVYSNIPSSKSDEALNYNSIECEPRYKPLVNTTNVDKDSKVKEKKRLRFSSIKQLKSLIPLKSPYIDIKILIIGDKYSGKTAIIERFVYGTFTNTNSIKTTSYETKLMKLHNNKQFCLHIFEVTGDISNSVVSPTCVSNVIGALIVCDINETKAFCSIKKWKRNVDAKAKQTKYGEIPCILLANKCDSVQSNFNMCELDTYCSQQGILGWFDTSAKNDFNIKNAFVYLMQAVITAQRGLKSSILVGDNKRKYIMNHFSFGLRRRKVLFDEESTTML